MGMERKIMLHYGECPICGASVSVRLTAKQEKQLNAQVCHSTREVMAALPELTEESCAALFSGLCPVHYRKLVKGEK